MSGKSDAWEKALLSLVFHGKSVPGVARGNTSDGFLYVSLHTADPQAGDQSTNEIDYIGYERVAVRRDPTGWSIRGNSVSPVEDVEFPIGKGGSGTATFIGVGIESGFLLWSGPLVPSVDCGNGIQPILAKESTITEN